MLAGLLLWGLGPAAAQDVAARAARKRASLLMQQGRFAEAASLLAPLAAASPGDADLQYRLGLCLSHTDDLAAALQAMHRAHRLRQTEAVYVAGLARLYAAYPSYERASYWYRKLLVLRPGNMRLCLEAAQYALQQNQPLEAELLLKRALEHSPGDTEGWLLLGQCYQQLKLKAEAAQCFEKAVKTPGGAGSSARRAALLREVIALYTEGGQPDKALPYLQLAQRLQPRNADLFAQAAECQLAVNNPTAALAAYRQAARLAPREPRYHLAVARLLAETDAPGALAEYEQAFAYAQPGAEQLLAAASLASRAGNTAAALSYLSRLVALKPQEPEPRTALAQAALAGGDELTAVLQWRELLRAGEVDCGAQEAELALRLGGREWALGRLQELAPAAREDPAVAARVASMLAQLGETVAAAPLAEAALAKARGEAGTEQLAAEVLLQCGELDQAESVFRRLYHEQPGRYEAGGGLARCLLRRGQARQAYDLMQGIVRQRPRDFRLVQTLLEAAEACAATPLAATLLAELVQADPANDDLLAGLTEIYRRTGGPALAARRLLALSSRSPDNGRWALAAAEQLVASGSWEQAAAIYERLARGSEYTVSARTALCELLLSQQRYADVLTVLARLTGPQAVGAEAYRLLVNARAELILQRGTMQLDDLARAASAVCLAKPQSESYYLALADLYLATGEQEAALGFLQTRATGAESGPAAVGLARLLRKLGRAREAQVWLEQLPPGAPSPRALLERAYCQLAASLPFDAAASAEQALQGDEPTVKAEAHLVAAEACLGSYRPEEALWHYCQALGFGADTERTVAEIVSLCDKQPLQAAAVVNAVQQLYAIGLRRPALALADALSTRPAYGKLRSWAVAAAAER